MSTSSITLSPLSADTGKYAVVSLNSNSYSPVQKQANHPSFSVTIRGSLPYGRRLLQPITINITEDDDEFVVSEPNYHIHGEGATVPEAIDSFKRILSGYLDVLSEEENNLSPYMDEQLKYLHSIMGIEQ